MRACPVRENVVGQLPSLYSRPTSVDIILAILVLGMFSALALLVADDPYHTYRVGADATGGVTVDMYLHSPHPCTRVPRAVADIYE